jgi:hypothetical protein
LARLGLSLQLSKIARQRFMNVSGCNGGMAGRDGDLVQVGHDVSGSVKSLDRGVLMPIDFQAADLGSRGT